MARCRCPGPLCAAEHDHPPASVFDAPFAVAPAGRLDDPVEGTDGAKQQREIDIHAGNHDMSARGFYVSHRFAADTMLDMGDIKPHGRYVHHPAITDARGVVSVPPPVPDPLPKVLLAMGAAAAVGAILFSAARADRR